MYECKCMYVKIIMGEEVINLTDYRVVYGGFGGNKWKGYM